MGYCFEILLDDYVLVRVQCHDALSGTSPMSDATRVFTL